MTNEIDPVALIDRLHEVSIEAATTYNGETDESETDDEEAILATVKAYIQAMQAGAPELPDEADFMDVIGYIAEQNYARFHAGAQHMIALFEQNPDCKNYGELHSKGRLSRGIPLAKPSLQGFLDNQTANTTKENTK